MKATKEIFEISSRLYRVLYGSNIRSVAELYESYMNREVHYLRTIGKKSIKEIEQILEIAGYPINIKNGKCYLPRDRSMKTNK